MLLYSVSQRPALLYSSFWNSSIELLVCSLHYNLNYDSIALSPHPLILFYLFWLKLSPYYFRVYLNLLMHFGCFYLPHMCIHFLSKLIKINCLLEVKIMNRNKISSVQFSRSVVSNSLQTHESQHTRAPCPSPSPGVHSNSYPSSWWCHPAISSSVVPFSSCP